MMSPETIETYRHMTPRERFAVLRSLQGTAERALRVLPREEIERRLDAERDLRRESVEALVEALDALERTWRKTSTTS